MTIPEAAAEAACTCTVVDPKYWTTHYGAVEPGSMLEPDYGCPEHFPNATSNYRHKKPTVPVPMEYCGGGVCWRLADRWEHLERYNVWIPVCNEHGDRIVASEAAK